MCECTHTQGSVIRSIIAIFRFFYPSFPKLFPRVYDHQPEPFKRALLLTLLRLLTVKHGTDVVATLDHVRVQTTGEAGYGASAYLGGWDDFFDSIPRPLLPLKHVI